MGLFSKMKEPVFLKEGSSLKEQLEKLKALEPMLNEAGKAKIRQDIRCMEAGIYGENNIAFELKNSHIPMYVIHDLHLKDGDLTSQIDYLVITRKLRFIIECKNLYGDIEIDNQGAFVRTMRFGKGERREGIYSPVTQNQRHMALLKKIRSEQAGGLISRFFRDRYFEENHRAVIVLANPKTVLYAKYAKKEIKSQVIRADQLVDYIKEMCNNSRNAELSDREMKELAQCYLDMDQEQEIDYLEKYRPFLQQAVSGQESFAERTHSWEDQETECEVTPVWQDESQEDDNSRDMEKLIGELKRFRWNTSQAEGIKPYYIFNNNQMMDLIEKFPADLDQLKEVSGFGHVKVQKYGQELLAILDQYR